MYQQLKHFCIRYSICSYFYYYLFSFSHFIRASPIDLIYLIALTINFYLAFPLIDWYNFFSHSYFRSLPNCIFVHEFYDLPLPPPSLSPSFLYPSPSLPTRSLSNRSVQWAEKLAYMSLSDPVPHSMNGWIIFTTLWWSILYNIYTL